MLVVIALLVYEYVVSFSRQYCRLSPSKEGVCLRFTSRTQKPQSAYGMSLIIRVCWPA